MPTPINGNKNAAGKIQPANRSLRSRDMNEVIAVKPGFIINWGMYVMLAIFCAAIFLTRFMKFPETVNVDVLIRDTASANNTGKFLATGHIRLKNGESIQAGQKVFLQLPGKENTKMPQANVESVGAASADSGHTLIIAIRETLISGYNLPVSAKATIRVGEQTLFNKLFANLLPAFKKKETTL